MTKELCRRLGDNVIQNVVIMIVTVYLSLTKTVDKLYEMLLVYIVSSEFNFTVAIIISSISLHLASCQGPRTFYTICVLYL